METLHNTIRQVTDWSVSRVHTLCDTDDPMDYLDAHAIVQEFEDWMDPDMKDHDVYSLEYIGEGSEYDG
tara:strand:+ start:44 stop:250 length:207 start_codon:yes stop_codon:yes gene_type:complete